MPGREFKKESMACRISRIMAASMLCIFIFTAGTVQAQAPDEPSTDDPAVPVDGGISLLLAAGTAYGARRLRQ